MAAAALPALASLALKRRYRIDVPWITRSCMVVKQRIAAWPKGDHVRLAGRVRFSYRNYGRGERRSGPSNRVGDKRIARSCVVVLQRIVGPLRDHVRLASRAYDNCGCRERRCGPSNRIGDKGLTRSCMIVEQRVVRAFR